MRNSNKDKVFKGTYNPVVHIPVNFHNELTYMNKPLRNEVTNRRN